MKGSINNGGSVEVNALPVAKRGRRVLLGVELDEAVQSYVYIKQLHKKGGGIASRIVIAGAQGIISVHDQTLLAENGGSLLLTKDWALSLLRRCQEKGNYKGKSKDDKKKRKATWIRLWQ